MNKEKEYIVPMMFKLEDEIYADIYFLSMPKILKEKLMDLEEKSNIKFNRSFHYLPLNSLKKLFVTYLDGVVDMKAVSNNTIDDRWIVADREINTNLVTNIIINWIEAFYIEETELEKKRKNSDEVKEYAKSICEELEKIDFTESVRKENLLLFKKGINYDKDGFRILPLLVINNIIGTDIDINGQNTKFYYSGKNEIVTNPTDLKDVKDKDYFSYAANFSVQTLPPKNEAYLNVNISIRRWISRNEEEIKPFLDTEKTVYLKIEGQDKCKLQPMRIKYDSSSKKIDWVFSDKKCYYTCYDKSSNNSLNNPEDILIKPEEYINNALIPFEYGMGNSGKKIKHNMDAGESFSDYKTIFLDIMSKLPFKTNETTLEAIKLQHRNENADSYFNDYFEIKNKDRFNQVLDSALFGEKLTVEIWYNGGNENIVKEFKKFLNNHLYGTDSIIATRDLGEFSEALELKKENSQKNLEGFNERVDLIENNIEHTNKPTLAFIILPGPDEFKLKDSNGNEKKDGRVDPKGALRIGFAHTGRLTQFITPEAFNEVEKKRQNKIKNYNIKMKQYEDGEIENVPKSLQRNTNYNQIIKNTILDGYRQLGILSDVSKKKLLRNTIISGIYVCNYKNTKNGTTLEPFTIMITCDFEKMQIKAYTKMETVMEYPYWKFILELSNEVCKKGRNRRIKTSGNGVIKCFEKLINDEKNHLIVVEADGTSRKLIKGISNSEIVKHLDEDQKQIKELYIEDFEGGTITADRLSNISLLRVRVNNEVSDYYPGKNEKQEFMNKNGVYKYEDIYYSLDTRTERENMTFDEKESRINNNSAFTHRNIEEIYPMYVGDNFTSKEHCVLNIHNLRRASIQFETQKTILPLPLHLAKLIIDDYII